MSKFLKLIEENKPGEGPFTVEYKDKDGNLMATVTLPNDVGSSYENFLKFAEESGGHLNVEDNEQIQKAAKAAGTVLAIPDQGAKSLIPGSTASKVQKLKKNLINKLTKDLKASKAI